MSLLRGPAAGEQPMAGWMEGERMYADKQLVIRHTIPTNGLSFAGIIDVNNADAVAAALRTQLTGNGDLHLELSRVEFWDVSGIRALVAAAEGANGRRRFVLHGLAPLLRKVMTLVGWAELPGLSICNCGEQPK
jgi:anti-anti-sigma regulatory factor